MKYLKLKMIVVFVCMTLGCTGNIAAQIHSSGFQYYKETNSDNAVIAEFHGSYAYVKSYVGNLVKSEIKKNPDELERNIRYDNESRASIDNELSTTNRTVYKLYSPASPGGWSGGWIFYAVSEDGTSLIRWIGGRESDRKYYYKVDKEYYLPKAANYDFLNE